MNVQTALIAVDTADKALLEQIRELLLRAGHRIAEGTVAAAESVQPDLWILDAPLLPQAEILVQKLKRRPDGSYVPLIALLNDDADSEGWLDGGFDEVIRLPLARGKLLTRLRILLRLRRQSLAAARESQARHTAVLDSAIDAVVTFDPSGSIVEFNPAAESMFLTGREDILGKPLFEYLIPPDLSAEYRASFEEYVRTGQSAFVGRRAEVRCVRSSGERFPAEINVTKIEAHGYLSFTAFIRDLTEQKRAEHGLAQLASIIESSEEAIISMALDGRINTWNRGAEQLFGYTAVAAASKPFHMLLPAHRETEVGALLLSVALGRRYMDFGATGVRSDGSQIDIALSVSPIRAATGEIIGASAIAYDMSEIKNARQALQQSEERYRSLVAATTSIVFTSDGRGRFVDAQESWAAYTGQSWPKHEDWDWAQMFHPEDRAVVIDGLRKAVNDRSVFETTVRLWHMNSRQYRYCALRTVPILLPDRSIREWIGTITDVHDAKRAEEAIQHANLELEQRVAERTADLAAANRELEAFSYSVSHDLRAPLRAIAGFTRIVMDAEATSFSPEAQRLMLRVGANVERMDALISDLLSFSRMSRMAVAKRGIAPDALAREVADEVLAEHDGRDIHIDVQAMPTCSADPSLLRQVFINLISNAVKYTRSREKAQIVVRCLVDEDPLKAPVYSVRDNGMGFDMRHATKLFQVFERLHSAQEAEGTGVGLALVRRIVERHGGMVWAESVPDEGATFYFTLEPAAEERSQITRAVRPAA
jgi:PAS domain S-box-containing protein